MSNPAPGFTKYPAHRVVATESPCRVRVLVGEVVIADSRRALRVEESRHDPVWYLPPDDVNTTHLTPTASSTYCPFKGHASYWTIEADGTRLEDAAWAYLQPYDECLALAGYIAFYADRVSLEVDGTADRAQRPT